MILAYIIQGFYATRKPSLVNAEHLLNVVLCYQMESSFQLIYR